MLKTLKKLGFEELDAQVYIFIGRKGPQKAKDIVKALKIPKQKLYSILKNLQSKGVVNATFEHPARFSVISFEKVLDIFVKSRLEEAQQIQRSKNEILSEWKSISINEVDSHALSKFMIIESKKNIYSKLNQIAEDAKECLLINLPLEDILRADQVNFLDIIFKRSLKNKINIRFLTELSSQNINAIQSVLKQKPKASTGFEARAPDLGLKLSNRMIIRDGEEAMFFINQYENRNQEISTCFWTDCKSIVDSFSFVFED